MLDKKSIIVVETWKENEDVPHIFWEINTKIASFGRKMWKTADAAMPQARKQRQKVFCFF